MNLWEACETVARQKRGLSDEYTMCAADLNKGGSGFGDGQWVEAHVELGIKQPRAKGQRYSRWLDIKKVVIYPPDVAPLLALETDSGSGSV